MYSKLDVQIHQTKHAKRNKVPLSQYKIILIHSLFNIKNKNKNLQCSIKRTKLISMQYSSLIPPPM